MHANMTRHAFAAPAARPILRSSRPRPCVAPRATPPRPTEADPNNPLDQVHACRVYHSRRMLWPRLLRVWRRLARNQYLHVDIALLISLITREAASLLCSDYCA